ncbi:MAG: hypothetical protein V4627_01370 [Pseudomonadota bacterium]
MNLRFGLISKLRAGISPVFIQLFSELRWPLAIAFFWTTYNYLDLPGPQQAIRSIVNVFAPAFFLLCWASSQWLRVKKHQKIDSDFESIDSKIEKMLGQIEHRTNEVISSVTGGDSACYLAAPTTSSETWSDLSVVHIGRYPLYQLSLRAVDLDILDEMRSREEDSSLIDRSQVWQRYVGDVPAGFITSLNVCLRLDSAGLIKRLEPDEFRRFNVYFYARNGSYSQLLRFKNVSGKWLLATKLLRDEVVLYENVDDGYPVGVSGQVDWG